MTVFWNDQPIFNGYAWELLGAIKQAENIGITNLGLANYLRALRI